MRVLRSAVTVTVGLALLLAAEGALAAQVKRVGTLVAIPREDVAGTYDHYLRSGVTLRRLELPREPRVRPGARIRATGTERANGRIDVASIQRLAPAPAPTTSGNLRVLIMLAASGSRDALTPAAAAAQLNGSTSDWFREVSGGLVSLTATATPWLTVPATDCSDVGARLDRAVAAARAAGWVTYRFPIAACDVNEYGDVFDAMGGGYGGHFNAAYKETLGWLDGDLATVAPGGSVTLTPFVEGTGIRAASVRAGGSRFVVEYRRPQGLDGFMIAFPSATNGVIVHDATSAPGGSTLLLDGQPDGILDSPALPAGQSVTMPGGTRIRVDAVTADEATISVLADTTPPTVREASPAAGDVDVPRPWGVTVSFSEAMDRPATEAAFTLVREPDSEPVVGRFQWIDNDSRLYFNAADLLDPGATYRVRLAGARDLAGNALATQSWTFTTEGSPGDANLVGNRSFETDTTGWGSYQGQLSRVASADAPHGGFVARAARTSGTFYSVGDSENGFRPTVASTVAGATYIATGYARAASASAVGKPVKITLRERNAANVTVREISTTATLGTDFTRLAVSADAAASGNTLGMRLEQSKAVAGDAFDADWMSLVRARPITGDTDPGAGWTRMSANTKRVSGFARPTSYTFDIAKLRVYVDGKAATSGSQTVRGLVYDDNDGRGPGVLLRRTEQVTIRAGRAAGWLDLKLTSPVGVAYEYWFGLQSGPNVVARFAHTAPGTLAFNGDAFSDGPTDPFGTHNTDGKRMSIHAIGG